MSLLHYDFLSDVLGYQTNVYLILPDNTPKEEDGTYKTLYLLHGGGGNGLDWIRFTSIERYAQEAHVAVVMPEVDGKSFYSNMKYGYDYFRYLSEELPMVMETLFPIAKKSVNRYVAGLSMGGYGAFKWAFLCPQFFAAAANLSGFSFITEIFDQETGFAAQERGKKDGVITMNWGSLEELKGSDDDSKTWIDKAVQENVKLPRLFAGIGTEDFSYQFGLRYIAYAKENGIDIHYEEMAGQHEWKVWDEMIVRFLHWI